MPEVIRTQSALAEFLAAARRPSPPAQAGVYLSERAFLGHLDLRGDPKNQAFLEAVQRCLGIALPLEPNTVRENSEFTALWLGPDEWLLWTAPGQEEKVARALREALHGLFFALTDVSHGQTIIRIWGDRATDVLYKGCSLDLHPRAFPAGHCAQTHVARAGVLIRRVANPPSFDLLVRRSFAEYLALWLQDAAQEYGLVVT